MKARLGCRGVLETRFPRLWLSLTSDKMKVEATIDKESESTLFYLIPTGMREVCIQHIASRNFIAINHNGKLISKACENTIDRPGLTRALQYGTARSSKQLEVDAIVRKIGNFR